MPASEIAVNVLFYVFAAASVAGAVGVAASRNIVRSAFALLSVLFSAAALYALMKADFIAAAQVLIYVGGILVLIIFAVMLTHRITDVNISNESTPGPAAFCAVLCLLFALVVIILPLPYPGPNKWDAGRGAEPSRDGPFVLAQYQSDGKTGLAAGGSTIEEELAIAVTIPEDRRHDVLNVSVIAIPTDDSTAQGKVTAFEAGKSVSVETDAKEKRDFKIAEETKNEASTAVGKRIHVWAKEGVALRIVDEKTYEFTAAPEGETTFVRLRGLPEGAYNWSARLLGSEGSTELAGPKANPDFILRKGVTESIALALANPYLLAFEAVSMLLLAALVGAAFLARKEVKE